MMINTALSFPGGFPSAVAKAATMNPTTARGDGRRDLAFPHLIRRGQQEQQSLNSFLLIPHGPLRHVEMDQG